jgi:hypothetical protein
MYGSLSKFNLFSNADQNEFFEYVAIIKRFTLIYIQKINKCQMIVTCIACLIFMIFIWKQLKVHSNHQI